MSVLKKVRENGIYSLSDILKGLDRPKIETKNRKAKRGRAVPETKADCRKR